MRALNIAVLREREEGERRVALAPTSVAPLKKAKCQVLVEKGAGEAAGYSDEAYAEAGATLASREECLAQGQVIATVLPPAEVLPEGKVGIALYDPLTNPAKVPASGGATLFSLDLIPRTTRAQAMDVLSSQANLAGYLGVLIGASELPKVFPMMTTAAGTLPPARVLILGAGVAGLQAIATARRLGAVVFGYDVRSEVREQIESLGAKFLVLDLETQEGASSGGYAKAMTEEQLAKQRELLGDALAGFDMAVTTAAVPGRKAPILITQAMAEKMHSGSVIVDLAAERGGNCELTKAGETVVHKGVKVLGPAQLPSRLATHATALFSKNVQNFILNMVKDGELNLNMEDEIIKGSLLAEGGQVVHPQVKERLEAAK